jgi:hypothetical protein
MLAACLAVAVTSPAAAQQAQSRPTFSASSADVSRLLRSADAKDVAWGAFTAAQFHVVEAAPLIAEALARPVAGDDRARSATELALLDALVQLEARVPAATLQPLVDRWPVPALILMANATGDRDAALLPLVSSTTGPLWHAVANLLVGNKPRGFAARLLTGLRLTLTVHVTTDPNSLLEGGLSGGGEHMGPGWSAPGFPPLADYRFSIEQPGATVLSVGPRRVYYARRMMKEPVFAHSNYSSPTGPDVSDRVLYLNTLINRQNVLREHTDRSIVWKSPREFCESLAEARRSVESAYRSVIQSLVFSGQLTEDESRTLVPAITVGAHDHRAGATAVPAC